MFQSELPERPKNRNRLSARVKLLAFGVGFAASLACAGLFESTKSASRRVFECEVAVLEPALGDVFDTEEVVRGWYLGNGSLLNALLSAGNTLEQAIEIKSRLEACDPRNQLKAPPPAPGNKVIQSDGVDDAGIQLY